MTRVVVWWLLGFVLATILWFGLSPFLTDAQEDLVSLLLTGSTLVLLVVVLLRARRRARGRSS
jgi:uncharacterized membrane protein